MALHIVTHPLSQSLVTALRSKDTQPARFRRLCHRLTSILVLEATRPLPTKPHAVETPMETHVGVQLGVGLIVVPVLRAGLGMVEPVLELYPDTQVGHVGVERDHTTALPRSYYAKLPQINGHHILIVDPMLATGGSLLHVIDAVKQAGGESITVVTIVSAPEGVKAIQAVHPEIPIYTAALDRCLNDQKYILPGIGDFGDRLMGT